MAENLSREKEQQGTRRLMMWAVAAVAVIFIVLLALFVFGPWA
ncbi:hypothetical protein X740_28830 [Mesorhizobium sp. LNHC221B00]|nr:hypothetical protein X742_27220 [Mesorhizobium sp. LNHC232B00]ESY76491.1 hypothetical protein X740_28830 [Mesorhizobium sp. LNHC221B00]